MTAFLWKHVKRVSTEKLQFIQVFDVSVGESDLVNISLEKNPIWSSNPFLYCPI